MPAVVEYIRHRRAQVSARQMPDARRRQAVWLPARRRLKCLGRKWKGPQGFTLRPLWLRGGDLNPRPLGYEPNELPDCSTPRHRGRQRTQPVEDTTPAGGSNRPRPPGPAGPGGASTALVGAGTSRMMNKSSPGLIRPNSRRARSSIAAGPRRRRPTCSPRRSFSPGQCTATPAARPADAFASGQPCLVRPPIRR